MLVARPLALAAGQHQLAAAQQEFLLQHRGPHLPGLLAVPVLAPLR